MDLETYDAHTEALIEFLALRVHEDEVLAGATTHPRLTRAVLSGRSIRDAVHDYRAAADRAADTDGPAHHLWFLLARYHAYGLRLAGGVYADRPGFDRAWLKAPRQEG